jgi:glyoxylase-like metal-dependent hydrolase (beta-lactamase superfamily II)
MSASPYRERSEKQQAATRVALDFNREFAPPIGRPVDVAPGIRRVTAGNPSPFTFRGTNTFLIGADSLAVLDPGPADPTHVAALMAAIGGASVAHILVSHTHRDHSPAARLLQAETGAPILAAGPHRPARPPQPGEEVRLDAGGDAAFAPDIALADGATIEGDGYRLEAIATPGHAANHLVFAWPERALLFSGDHVMGWATTSVAPPDGSMTDYMASLDRLLARPERLYLPAHGPEIADGPAFTRALRTHRKMREAAIVEALRRGDRAVPEIVKRVYAGLDPALMRAAGLSTLAHLEDLFARGLVAADGPPTLAARYWLADAMPPVLGSG